MKNQVNFFGPRGLAINVGGVQDEIMDWLNKNRAHTVPTQVLVYEASYGTIGADEVIVLCANAAIVDEHLIITAVQQALKKVEHALCEKDKFSIHLLHWPHRS